MHYASGLGLLGVPSSVAPDGLVGAFGLDVASKVAPVAFMVVLLGESDIDVLAILALAAHGVESSWYAFLDPVDLVAFKLGTQEGGCTDVGADDVVHCCCLSWSLMVRLVEPIPFFIPVV
jgi:hypothetical protein